MLKRNFNDGLIWFRIWSKPHKWRACRNKKFSDKSPKPVRILLNATEAAPAEAKTAEQREAVIEAANSFGGTIGRLLSLQESYPQLHSSEAFMKVQDELAGTENRIAVKREDYNKVVTDYNTTRNQFPAVMTASLFGFSEEPFFKAQPGAEKAPDVGDPNAQ